MLQIQRKNSNIKQFIWVKPINEATLRTTCGSYAEIEELLDIIYNANIMLDRLNYACNYETIHFLTKHVCFILLCIRVIYSVIEII